VIHSFIWGYVFPSIYFGAHDPLAATTMFAGTIVVNLVVLANIVNIGLLFDMENVRYIDFQLTLLSPRLIMVQRILFTSFFTFIILAPFFPISKLLLGSWFVTTNTCWPALMLIVYLGALVSSAYTQLYACIVPNSRKLRSFWMRINFALITFAGFLVPWYVMKQFSSILGYVLLLNPLLYITEGLRQAILGSPQYLSLWICCSMLMLWTALLTVASWYFFKKRADHV
jgi:ABC-2 type transport system permease protein